MSSLTATVWFIGSVLNLAALIHAWVFLFDILNKELHVLEEEHRAKLPVSRRDPPPRVEDVEASSSQGYSQLHSGPAAASAAAVASEASEPPPLVEPEEDETVADRLSYQLKKKILSRFAFGVYAYLGFSMLLILLPAFFFQIVQSILQVSQVAINVLFCVWLLYIYRPVPRSNYLMIGFSDDDADSRGVTELATGIGMSDLESATGTQGGESLGSRISKKLGIDGEGGGDSEGGSGGLMNGHRGKGSTSSYKDGNNSSNSYRISKSEDEPGFGGGDVLPVSTPPSSGFKMNGDSSASASNTAAMTGGATKAFKAATAPAAALPGRMKETKTGYAPLLDPKLKSSSAVSSTSAFTLSDEDEDEDESDYETHPSKLK
eukprot:CAMPEP_0175046620 /NCGR_PEP_ID=MMETSP0052_2-20121109/5132_1 /TAXON_ID=51329 ORGANISM="Polytomella parva, Strain SAG 63-3" /NCGR_SAMPLE_ID=MMETSP0052_2 /ASSEMBLY_ACC=CAM_ASM_000194 /LENGTH=375 /DNA_ID=CAMNT_0016310387 /DNA_START=576 /DNA_END=1703 /DNA_ORIENTATION=+